MRRDGPDGRSRCGFPSCRRTADWQPFLVVVCRLRPVILRSPLPIQVCSAHARVTHKPADLFSREALAALEQRLEEHAPEGVLWERSWISYRSLVVH
jgi:hypothetical protein